MIDLLFTLGAVAEAKAQVGPAYAYELPAEVTDQNKQSDRSRPKTSLLPKLRFDDSQGCLSFLVWRVEGFGTIRIGHPCSDGSEQPAPWRSL